MVTQGRTLDEVVSNLRDALALHLEGLEIVSLRIVGHTDSQGIRPSQRHLYPDNHALGLARARAVLCEQERTVVHDLSNAVADLERAYQSQVDPRLNYEQAIELSLVIARRGARLNGRKIL